MKIPDWVMTVGLVVWIIIIRLLVIACSLLIVEHFAISYWFLIPLMIFFIGLFELIFKVPLIFLETRGAPKKEAS